MTRRKKEIVLAQTPRIAIVRVTGRRDEEDCVVLKNKRTGFYTAWNLDELFDLVEQLDDVCDAIEDKEHHG